MEEKYMQTIMCVTVKKLLQFRGTCDEQYIVYATRKFE